jgi:WD40 repeat protein
LSTKDNRQITNRIKTGDRIDVITFSPDGKLLITGAKETHVWDVESGRNLCTLSVDTEGILAIGSSENLDQVLAATREGSIVAWQVGEICNKP